MFDLVHKHKKLIQLMLAVIFLPFAFFGIDSYFRSSDGGNHVACPLRFGPSLSPLFFKLLRFPFLPLL